MSKSLEEYNKELSMGMKAGYTTGTCACAAAKAALMLMLGKKLELVRVNTPAGISLDLEVLDVSRGAKNISLAVRKYSGDDPDVTDGALVYVSLRLLDKNLIISCEDEALKERLSEALLDRDLNKDDENIIFICGGKGVGKVTKPGLDRAVGEAAVNSVPRRMIRKHLLEILKEEKLDKDILVEISVQGGEELAKRTFNERLGVLGGISILGTSGIVTPMSKQALIDTIKVDMRSKRMNSDYIVAAPGNYGMAYIADRLGIDEASSVEFSNFIGEAIDIAVDNDCKGLLIVGHIGKLVKLAGGIMNTHSNDADSRCELIAAHLIKSEPKNMDANDVLCLAKKLLYANTTDECVLFLKEAGVLKEVMDSLAISMYRYAKQRVSKALILGKKIREKHGAKDNYYDDEDKMKIGILTFTLSEGELARAGDVEFITQKMKKGK